MTDKELNEARDEHQELRARLKELNREFDTKTTAVVKELLEGKYLKSSRTDDVVRVDRVLKTLIQDNGCIVARVHGTVIWLHRRFGDSMYIIKDMHGEDEYYSIMLDPDFSFNCGYMHFITKEEWDELYNHTRAIDEALYDCRGRRITHTDDVVYIKDDKLTHGMVRGFNEETMALQILHDFDDEAGVMDERPGAEVYLV